MRWRVRLFDGPLLESASGDEVRRFRSRKVGALLAYLALRLGKHCPREELVAALWPDELDSQVSANRLRVTLASLRRQLEPSGVPFGSVLDVSNTGLVALRSESVWCDTAALERALRAGEIGEAARLVKGDLLPGMYEDWAQLERQRFEAMTESLPVIESEPEEGAVRTDVFRNPAPLPFYLTRFVGRHKEIESLVKLIEANRLVTVVGPGGMGKTRISVETAPLVTPNAIFVPLADVGGPAQVVEAVLRALGVAPSAEDLTEQIVAFLSRRDHALLILDNAEHVLEGVAELAMQLLEAAPEVCLLVTSRQRLDIAGEAVFPLEPLEMPTPRTRYDELVEIPAVALFLDRARNARPDFVLTVKHASAMLEICRLLEGMPLALELAAARITAQTPTQIESSLATNLTGLKSRQRGLAPRHQSIAASIQGSLDLLSAELLTFFYQLSVFRGGWSVEAARFVTGCTETETSLEELVLRSLIVAHESDNVDEIRYHLLEPIRQYATESYSGTDRIAVEARHAEYFLSLAGQVSEDDIRTLQPLDAEQENLLLAVDRGSAIEWSIYVNGISGALIYAHVRGRHRRFLAIADIAYELAAKAPNIADRVRLMYSSYYIFSYIGRQERIARIGEVMRLESEEEAYVPGQILASLIASFANTTDRGFGTATELALSALAAAREFGDQTLIWRSLRIVAFSHAAAGRYAPYDSENDRLRALRVSESAARECLDTLPKTSSHRTFEILNLSYALEIQGNYDEAYDMLKLAQATALEHGMYSMLVFGIRQEAVYAQMKNLAEYAAIFDGAFFRLREMTGYNTYENPIISVVTRETKRTLGKQKLEQLQQRGRQLPLDELVAMTIHEALA